MKKILIVSDNHFQAQPLTDILALHQDIDYFVHCGDSQWEVNEPILQKFVAVRGNNDFVPFPEEATFEVEGHKILVVHGHWQDVYNFGDKPNIVGTEQLVATALTLDADIVFYGHTHVAECHTDRGVFVLNPGSVNYPRGMRWRKPTYAIVTLDGATVKAHFYDAHTFEDVSDAV